MARWAFKAFDLVSGLSLGDLALSSWSHTDALNDSGDFQGTLVWRRRALDRQAIDNTLVGKSLVIPYRNGVPLGFAGIVWRQDAPDFAGAGLLSYFDVQPLDTDKPYVSYDQHLMMVDLVNWVQTEAEPPGNILLDVSQVQPSLVLRDQTWARWEQKIIGAAFREKADNLGGFDFDMRIELDDLGLPVRRLQMWTPRRGRAFVQGASPVFSAAPNGNILAVPSAAADGLQMATVVIAQGEENPATGVRPIAVSVRQDLLDAGYPRLVKSLDLSDVSDTTTLQAHADGAAYYYGTVALDELVIEVNPDDPAWPWDSYEIGDDCQVLIPAPQPAGVVEVPAVPAHVGFPNAAGNYLTVPLVPPVDASFDVRVEVVRPTNPSSGQYRWSDGPFYIASTTTAISWSFLTQAVGFPGTSVAYATLEAAGLPLPGAAMQTRMTWDKTTDTLDCYWRDAALPVTDSTGWQLAGSVVSGGSAFQNSVLPSWFLGGLIAGEAMNGDVRRWWVSLNGSTVVDVNMATDIPTNLSAGSFTATTGQTVTVLRSGFPSTQLVSATPLRHVTYAVGQPGTPAWPTGLDAIRRITAKQWTRAGAEEHLYVRTGRLLGE